MAIGRTNAGGGGGGGLNFKVVGGTTAPTSPKENTIWVNTSVTIPSWAFSATEPGSPVEGMVWISTGTSSAVAFNALKKNDIQVYPMSAKQYVGGEWVSVEAKSCQGGEWVDWWDGTLYDSGNEFESITGGWEIIGNGSIRDTDIFVGTTSAALKSTNYAAPKNMIKLDDFSNLTVHFKVAASLDTSGSDVKINVVSEDNVIVASQYVLNGTKETKTDYTANIDVSSLTGRYAVRVFAGHTNSADKRTVYAEFDEVRMI